MKRKYFVVVANINPFVEIDEKGLALKIISLEAADLNGKSNEYNLNNFWPEIDNISPIFEKHYEDRIEFYFKSIEEKIATVFIMINPEYRA